MLYAMYKTLFAIMVRVPLGGLTFERFEEFKEEVDRVDRKISIVLDYLGLDSPHARRSAKNMFLIESVVKLLPIIASNNLRTVDIADDSIPNKIIITLSFYEGGTVIELPVPSW